MFRAAAASWFLCLTTIGLAASTPQDAPRPTGQREVNFGTVAQGDVVRQAFSLLDVPPGTAVSRVEVDQPGLSARFRRATEPGNQPQVRLEWNTAQVSGEVVGTAKVLWEDPAIASVTLTLRGMVRPPFDLTPLPAVFLSAFVGETKAQTLTIAVTGEEPVKFTRVEPQGTHFSAAVKTVEAGRRYELEVKVLPGTPVGRFMEKVVLHTTHPSRPTLAIPVNVLVKADVYVNPEDVDFGQIALAEASRQPSMQPLLTQTFIVRRRQGPFAITKVGSDVPWLKVAQDPAEGVSEAFRFDVSLDFPRLAAGTKLEGTITISTNDPRFPEIQVPVRGVVR